LQEIFAGLTFAATRFGEYLAELAFEYSVQAANLLLFAQLLTVPGQTLAGLLAMLTGGVRTPFDRTLVGKTFLAFDEEFFTLTTALAAFWIEIAGQLADSLLET
jgi:hypothetical protein